MTDTDTDTRSGFRDPPASYESGTKMPVHLIRPAPDNLRGELGELTELRASIARNGLYHPLLIAPLQPPLDGIDPGDDGCKFICVDGHRRLAAVIAEGFDRVNVVIRHMGEADRVEAMLATALQREDLKPSEEAEGYRRLTELKLSQRDIAERFGVSQGHVSKTLAIARLPEEARAVVDAGGISREDAVKAAGLPKATLAEMFAKGRQPRGWEIEEAVRRQELKVARAKAEADAKTAGLTVVDGAGYNRNQGPVWLSHLSGSRSGCDPEIHATKSCHAVAWNHNTMSDVCTDPASHPERTEEDDLAEERAAEEAAAATMTPDEIAHAAAARAQREAERAEREAELKAATDRRLAFCRDLISKAKPVEVIGLAAAVLPNCYEIDVCSFCRLLPVTVTVGREGDEEPEVVLAEWVGVDQRRQLQVLYAVVLTLGNDFAENRDGRYGRSEPYELRLQAAFWGHLRAHGYEMSELELAWLAKPEAEDVETEPAEIQECERCGCTEADCSGCIERTGGPCSWARPGLCSACLEPGEAEEIAGVLAAAGSKALAEYLITGHGYELDEVAIPPDRESDVDEEGDFDQDGDLAEPEDPEPETEAEFEGSTFKVVGIGSNNDRHGWECTCGANAPRFYDDREGAEGSLDDHMLEAHGYAPAEVEA